jgi:cyclase
MAQGQPAAALMVHQLKPNVYRVEGGGGNVSFIVGDRYVIVTDTKTSAAAGNELLDDIAGVTPKPVTAVILTHSDGDHDNGLAGGRGAPPAGRFPDQVVTKNKETLKIDGVRLEQLHRAPAHTSDDLIVYLPDEKIVFTEDNVDTNIPDASFISGSTAPRKAGSQP